MMEAFVLYCVWISCTMFFTRSSFFFAEGELSYE